MSIEGAPIHSCSFVLWVSACEISENRCSSLPGVLVALRKCAHQVVHSQEIVFVRVSILEDLEDLGLEFRQAEIDASCNKLGPMDGSLVLAQVHGCSRTICFGLLHTMLHQGVFQGFTGQRSIASNIQLVEQLFEGWHLIRRPILCNRQGNILVEDGPTVDTCESFEEIFLFGIIQAAFAFWHSFLQEGWRSCVSIFFNRS
eukprot:Skav234219  [mRNA]  locus=scaffold1464:19095:19731:+ [translate_table: standard]